jgi:hypothetical protein
MTDKPTESELRHPTSYPHANRVNVSREIAEARADLGKQATLGQMQAFDGEHVFWREQDRALGAVGWKRGEGDRQGRS